ncbi:ABC transporter permease subunit [Singulisphaera sp. Ch08]|uniref:ABC transporter permease subunit n=1 Tax=Singulisphaera sp. Ch08 TaxID=3120278 RepID=A0AAU7CKK0_9BACT
MSRFDMLRTAAWLIRDTFRQSLESRVFWMMLALSGLGVLTCLSIDVQGGAPLHRPDERPDFLPRTASDAERALAPRDGVDIANGSLTLAFGAFRIPLGRDSQDAVHFIQLVLAAGAADTVGLLLALVWTAGFLPAFLAPGAVTVLLAKPVPRGFLLLGKALGVLTFVAFQATVFFLGTWTALGIRTGIWDSSYLWGIPLLVLQFAIFFSVSALIAANRRRTVACLLGSFLFWFLCWGTNYGRHAAVALPELNREIAPLSPWLRGTVEVGYWALPKPADLSIILSRAIDAEHHFTAVPEFETVQRIHRFHPILSVLSSLVAAGLIFAAAVRSFATTDY